jgi:hypothetical protein
MRGANNNLKSSLTMDFTRGDFADEVATLRASRVPTSRAIGDNFAFEENVGPDRLRDFESAYSVAPGLGAAAASYFDTSVQGTLRTHIPSTFQPINRPALMASTISRNQKIVRLERIDDVLNKNPLIQFASFQKGALSRPKDLSVVMPFIRAINSYPGARPAFASFKAEVDADLRASDWLSHLIARLGLGHWKIAPGEVAHFALMEYTVEQVFKQTALSQPFAMPTVLEARNSVFFFPAPAGTGYGLTVDLDHAAARDTIREILHIRLDYGPSHLSRVAEFTGPTPPVDLAAARDAHLGRLRTRCGKPRYGSMMSGEVDS